MELTAHQIAEFLNGKVEGNGDVLIKDVSKIEAGTPGTLTFLANPKYTRFIYSTKASAIIVNHDFIPEHKIDNTLIRVQNAYESLAILLNLLQNGVESKQGIHPQSFVSETAEIGQDVYIGPFAVVSDKVKLADGAKVYPHVFLDYNVHVGKGTTLFAGVKIFRNCIIGANCIVHGNTVIGSDGFGFAQNSESVNSKIPQVGNVIVEDEVEIGSNCSIDRATLGSTIIRKGVKIDNLVQIAHNVEIGEHSIIVAQVGISGSTKIGKKCILGGQVGLVGHIELADEVKIGAQAGVSNSVKEKGTILQGTPAFKIRDFQKSHVLLKNLPKLNQELNDLRREIEKLKKGLA